MSLGENLQFLRKKNGITQEQLAEQLEVSRQSVSKWESDTTYPEMEKLLLLCQMFHVKMDDLVQKDVSLLYVEDKAHYDKHMNLFSKMMALGVVFSHSSNRRRPYFNRRCPADWLRIRFSHVI